MTTDAIADPKRLLKAIDEAEIVSLPSALPCGDAVCQIALEEDPKAKPKTKPKPKPKKGAKDEKPEEAPKSDVPALLRISWEAPEL